MAFILIVEDEAIIAMGYEAIAMEAGYNVTAIAHNTSSAFEEAQAQKPDVALVDIRLTDGLTGNEIALGFVRTTTSSPLSSSLAMSPNSVLKQEISAWLSCPSPFPERH